MFITGLGTAVPAQKFTQRECWEAFQESSGFELLPNRSKAILRKVLLGENGINSRYLCFDRLSEAFDLTPDTLHQRFARNAPILAAKACSNALKESALPVEAIDALIISTCTGYLCPGLTSYVSEILGLNPAAQLFDLVGHGCGAAIPNLRTAEALVASGLAGNVLSVCVEICSAALYLDDDPGVLVSACLFADAASAIVISQKPQVYRGARLEWLKDGCGSLLQPANRDLLRFETRHGMLRNILSLEVPKLAAAAVYEVRQSVLSAVGLEPGDITEWVLHGGGKNVLDAIDARLELGAHSLRFSREILREFGNISSPFVPFVLNRLLKDPVAAGHWYLSTFGAGFSCHAGILRVETA